MSNEDIQIRIRHLENLLKVTELEYNEANEKYRELYESLEFEVIKRTEELEKARQDLILKNRILKEKQDKLSESEKQFRDLFENIPDAIIIIDQNFKIKAINPAVSTLFNRDEKELIDKEIIQFVSENDKKNIEQIVNQSFTDPSKFKGMLYRVSTIRNKSIEFSINQIMQQNELRLLLIVRDISIKAKAEQAIIEAKLRAEEANRAKSEFLANMSHELRTPLNAIIGFSAILMEDTNCADKSSHLDSINSSGKKLQHLLEDLITLSKLEAGKYSLNMDFVDIKNVFNNLQIFYSGKISNAVHFNVKYDADFPSQVLTDEAQLGYLLNKLLDNAFKFTYSGNIDIVLKIINKNVNKITYQIIVSDTGIGIDKKELQEIFSPFHQVDKGNTKKYGGSGIGLSIVYNLVNLLKGTILIKSEPKKGTRVILQFESELGKSISKSNETEKKETLAKNLDNCKICIIDDNPHNLKLYKFSLSQQNFKISTFNSALKFLTSPQPDQYNVIFMDLMMPEINGFEAYQKTRAMGIKTPVILLTANNDPQIAKQATEMGFNSVLVKPVDKKNLISTVKQFTCGQYLSDKDESTSDHLLKKNHSLVSAQVMDTLFSKWDKVKRTKVIRDVNNFAQEIKKLDDLDKQDVLYIWAKEISKATESFNIEDMNNLLEHFPDLFKNKRKK